MTPRWGLRCLLRGSRAQAEADGLRQAGNGGDARPTCARAEPAGSVMRRALVGERDRAGVLEFAFCLALHQHPHAALEEINIARLSGHNIGQVFDRPRQMRHQHFEFFNLIGHGAAFSSFSGDLHQLFAIIFAPEQPDQGAGGGLKPQGQAVAPGDFPCAHQRTKLVKKRIAQVVVV